MNGKKLAFFMTLICCLTAFPAALAAGPVDGEVGMYYWLGESETGGLTGDAEGLGARGEIWFFKQFGAAADVFELDYDDGIGPDESINMMNLDLLWRPISPTDNTFLALGAGWTDLDMFGADTSGLRVSAQGRVGFAGIFYAYGRLAYFPSLDDLEASGLVVATDVDGHEYDLGVGLEPFPFFSVWAGYRLHLLNYAVGPVGFETETSGFYAGVGLHF